jgi:serine/threonine protein kinase
MEDSDIKIIDFGLGKIFKHGTGKMMRMKSRMGTPSYVSPGILKGDYNEKCDIWAAGCLLYAMLSGYDAFFGDTDQDIYNRIREAEFGFEEEEWNAISKEAKDLICNMIKLDSNERHSAHQALEH